MEGFSSNVYDTFTSNTGCAEPMFFPQHILPLLPLYNAQWWGYESLTAIVLVYLYIYHPKIIVLHAMFLCIFMDICHIYSLRKKSYILHVSVLSRKYWLKILNLFRNETNKVFLMCWWINVFLAWQILMRYRKCTPSENNN